MEASSTATSAINFLSTTKKLTNPTKLLTFVNISKSISKPRNNSLSLSRCSTKPDTNTDNVGNQDPTFDIGLNSEQPKSPKPNSSDQLSSLSPSSASSSGGLVFDLGIENSWDSAEIGSPVVKRFLSDEEERWYMWYHGRSSRSKNDSKNPCLDSVGLAVSSNGVHWERGVGPVQASRDVGFVMSCGKDWWAFDTLSIRPSEVVIMSSSKVRVSSAVYWMYYTGFSSEEIDIDISDESFKFSLENPERFFGDFEGGSTSSGKIHMSLPGLAISQDGRYWARIEGEHHSGALFDVGAEKEWDSLFIASPQVVFHGNGDLRMYYHSFDVGNGEFCIGMARSRDGIRWVKLGKIIGGEKNTSGAFDEFGALNANVVRSRKDGKYLMAYEGVSCNGERSIGLAMSQDGLKNWTKFRDGPVLKASEAQNGWDNRGVGSPCLVQMDGEEDEWRLYYRGVGNEGRTGIGMAASHGSDFGRFTRWTGFHM